MTTTEIRAGWRTPAALYRLISSPALRAAFGWDLRGRDVRWVRPVEGMTCLEVGSGGGFYTKALARHLGAGSELIALDPDAASLEVLRQRMTGAPGARMTYQAGDGCALPLPDASMDALFYGYSLEEFADPLAAIHHAHRVLRPGGQLVLFLWRPVIGRRRREPVLDLLESSFTRERAAAGPQNIRLSYRR
ncbi:class I SAM-dependent methyltransferase [Amycolatopsis albispora]|uniref:Methyltransferase type 11 domain-containing protein n=1 Tax=Amycolatopsis albispora TaxID=1804986 RepID=A0A344L4L9_9PSEU|nr:class I SAM-dependent methyltransferase [Amycolatopsis albispora]AXB42993.1 hypothetical protein A4R43_10900 [Amycolatopsis albispora]